MPRILRSILDLAAWAVVGALAGGAIAAAKLVNALIDNRFLPR